MSSPETLRYIIEDSRYPLLFSQHHQPRIKLVDFDQCFPVSSPPERMLDTPLEFLAPEVAAQVPAWQLVPRAICGLLKSRPLPLSTQVGPRSVRGSFPGHLSSGFDEADLPDLEGYAPRVAANPMGR